MKKCALWFLASLFLVLSFSSCGNTPREQAQIKDLFQTFPETDEPYVLVTKDFLIVGDRQVLRSDLVYDGELCQHIVCLEDGIYAYVYASGVNRASVRLLRIPYDTLEPELVETVTAGADIRGVSYYDGGLYMKVQATAAEKAQDPPDIFYNLATGELLTGFSLEPSQLNKGTDSLRWGRYRATCSLGAMSNRYTVTDTESGETKEITKNVLKTCPEGKAILNHGNHKWGITDVEPVLEKDGEIYLFSNLLDDGILGYPNHCFLLKYDFESGTATFYTWIYFEEYQDVIDFYIP